MKQYFKPLQLVTLLAASIAFFACNHPGHDDITKKYDVVYVQNNDWHPNANAVLAYKDMGDGVLTPLPGSPFLTGGDGLSNLEQILGPADSDDEICLSSDGKFLITVNSGSNTIAVFKVSQDGGLLTVPGSPFPSEGETPVSVAASGNKIFVVNKSQDPLHPSTVAPNYTTFTIDGSGELTPVPDAKFETTDSVSPAQILVSKNRKFAYGADFLGFQRTPAVGTLRSFSIASDGKLSPVEETPYTLPIGAMPDNGALGLAQHPAGTPLYVGIPAQAKVGVFNVDQSDGGLSLVTTVDAGPAACWLRANSTGSRLYVLNSGVNTVQVYDITNSLAPVSIQVLKLKNSGPEYAAGPNMFTTSEDFSFNFGTDEKYLYVVSQHTNKDFTIGNFNFLHSVKIGEDGKLSEEVEPVQLPGENTIRPKGSIVLRRKS